MVDCKLGSTDESRAVKAMIKGIQGLHHVTSLVADANQNNAFFTKTLGLRRVKKTVNFDVPEIYHLDYGDELGTPGSVMTYFPYGMIQRGKRHGQGYLSRIDQSAGVGGRGTPIFINQQMLKKNKKHACKVREPILATETTPEGAESLN